jgi:hypothetical protein
MKRLGGALMPFSDHRRDVAGRSEDVGNRDLIGGQADLFVVWQEGRIVLVAESLLVTSREKPSPRCRAALEHRHARGEQNGCVT